MSENSPKGPMLAEIATLRAQLEEREAERAEQWRLRRDAEADRDTAKAVAAELREKLVASEARAGDLTEAIASARPAYVKLTNNVEFADNGAAVYCADQETMAAFDALFALSQPSQPAAQGPTT